MRCIIIMAITLCFTVAGASAQVGGQGTPWRGAGVQPCFGIDGGANKCPSPSLMRVIRAGHLFDSKTGTLLANQVVVISGEKIIAVGPAGKVKIPAGATVTDLSHETVLPGLVDMHTHMFNALKPNTSKETALLLAVQNTQADLHAGFTSVRDMSTHGNAYADVAVRAAISHGEIDGPRAQV
ncbi:MAG: amidohydrolase family protein, partial [Hyphomicrobiales bacterium]